MIEAVAILDCDCLREAARGDSEVVEEADAAEQDQAEAVPAVYESHRGFPLAASAGIVVVVQAQGDGLVAGDDSAPADGVQFLALVVGQVKAKLVCEQVAREDRVCSGVDQSLELWRRCALDGKRKQARTAEIPAAPAASAGGPPDRGRARGSSAQPRPT